MARDPGRVSRHRVRCPRVEDLEPIDFSRLGVAEPARLPAAVVIIRSVRDEHEDIDMHLVFARPL